MLRHALPVTDCRGHLLIREAAVDQFEHLFFTDAGVFHSGERGTRKRRLARGASPRHRQDHPIRQTRKPHGLLFTRLETQLVQPCQFEDRLFRHSHLQQAGNSVTVCKCMLAGASNAQQVNTAGIGEARPLRFHELRHFGAPDFE